MTILWRFWAMQTPLDVPAKVPPAVLWRAGYFPLAFLGYLEDPPRINRRVDMRRRISHIDSIM